jgi:hypothetical protein
MSGAIGGASNGAAPGGAPPDQNLVPDGFDSTPQGAAVIAGSPPPTDSGPSTGPNARSAKERMKTADHRGQDWALGQKSAKAVPVRRTIHVTVRNDQLAIMPDSAPSNSDVRSIPLTGDTVESLDDFVQRVREQIDGWGIAGDGLYWRPVVLLNVEPDGAKRASDLTRLLKNSGLDVRTDETARNPMQGSGHETR